MELESVDDDPQAFVWSRTEYVRLVESGVLGEEADLELVDGAILVKKREAPRHAAAMGRAQRLIETAFGDGFWVRVDRPLVLDDKSMPDPDLAVVKGAPDDFETKHPERALLVVEISDTSRGFDLGKKQRMYSRSGQPEYWCVDLTEEWLWVHREPGPRGYKSITKYERGDSVTALSSNIAVPVAGFFPKA
jgi:Uma2 family endonuclease